MNKNFNGDLILASKEKIYLTKLLFRQPLPFSARHVFNPFGIILVQFSQCFFPTLFTFIGYEIHVQ